MASSQTGRRRLANIRKLMRLAREWETTNGADLQGFVEMSLVRTRAGDGGARESEAPVESESLDAVRLMTIHRSKGLEFPVVCVADLGRQQTNNGGAMIRVGRDDRRVGLQIKRPGGGARINAPCGTTSCKTEQRESEDVEERRLFYVAVTRAPGASGSSPVRRPSTSGMRGNRSAPIGWVGVGVRARHRRAYTGCPDGRGRRGRRTGRRAAVHD